ncbi:MAG: prepilin-type N-terminal cleavage/methylation domain-containing protein [Candidatus Omnitrophica bacterium]|nr:hypothetical protein [bacterium]NUN98122.1 prepilin-type N-terminal cleavage/methylation domain-containing protein [Candidatus Omnitrophota bacterium]
MTPVRRVPRTSPRPKSAFTLIEVLSVIAVILILIGIAVPNVLGAMERAKNTEGRVLLQTLKSSVASYHTDTRQWPESGSEHLYYILGGYAPFSAKTSKRYKPPYMDFGSASVGKDNYATEYQQRSELQIVLKKRDGSTAKTLTINDLRYPSNEYPFPTLANASAWKPVLDPWERPVVYISPDDLRKHFDGDSDQPWDSLIAMDSELAVNKSGNQVPVPFGLNSGQFWSAGRDGYTAEADAGNPGFFQPGNLLGYDRRDNDGDSRVDLTDFKAKGGNLLPEDDLASW